MARRLKMYTLILDLSIVAVIASALAYSAGGPAVRVLAVAVALVSGSVGIGAYLRAVLKGRDHDRTGSDRVSPSASSTLAGEDAPTSRAPAIVKARIADPDAFVVMSTHAEWTTPEIDFDWPSRMEIELYSRLGTLAHRETVLGAWDPRLVEAYVRRQLLSGSQVDAYLLKLRRRAALKVREPGHAIKHGRF